MQDFCLVKLKLHSVILRGEKTQTADFNELYSKLFLSENAAVHRIEDQITLLRGFSSIVRLFLGVLVFFMSRNGQLFSLMVVVSPQLHL